MNALDISDSTIAVVGLGYVGLPLACALGRHARVIGFDIDERRVEAYRKGHDPSGELSAEGFVDTNVEFTNDASQLGTADVVIVAVPTPLDDTRRPDLSALFDATRLVGRFMRKGVIVVFESTVYPGLTEDECGPLLAEASGMRCGVDFKLGYSPERINPGDVEHSLASVSRIVAAQDEETLDAIDSMYRRIVDAGTHRAPSIRVAEAAKVLENTQRDINIALMNELALIFDRAGIDTSAVIDAAATKWNFVPYRPGLVGGHCIGVDPYYLTHLAEKLGYHPDVILAGRRVNDAMGLFVGRVAIKQLIAAGKNVAQSRVAILGVTFKENVADIRNSRVRETVAELRDHGVEVVITDPRADPGEVARAFGVPLSPLDELRNVDGLVVAVSHREYALTCPSHLRALCRHNPVLLDIKGVYDRATTEAAGFAYWRL